MLGSYGDPVWLEAFPGASYTFTVWKSAPLMLDHSCYMPGLAGFSRLKYSGCQPPDPT